MQISMYKETNLISQNEVSIDLFGVDAYSTSPPFDSRIPFTLPLSAFSRVPTQAHKFLEGLTMNPSRILITYKGLEFEHITVLVLSMSANLVD